MRKFLLPLLLIASTFVWATPPTITIDGDKSDWAEVPMLTQPGSWPMLKVLPAADAVLGDNALAFMLENSTEFTSDWSKYLGTYIDKDHNPATGTAHWTYSDMGTDFNFTTGMDPGTGWVDFPKGKSTDYKVIEMGVPSSCLVDLGSKFDIGMYYGTGGSQEWFVPLRSGDDIDKKIGLFYKTRSFTTLPGTVTAANAYAHNCIGECTSYVDFGLRDNGNDTARWAAFPVELTKPGMYDITTNVSSTLGWKFEFWLVDVATNVVVAHMDAPASNISSSKTSHNFGILDLTSVPAGKYMLKVKNRTQYSTVKLESVKLDYKGGAIVDIPETLLPEDATLSPNAWVKPGTVDSLLFTAEGSYCDNASEWVKWKVNVTKAGIYNFTANTFRKSGSMKFNIAVLNSDESSELISNNNGGSSIGSSGNASISTGNVTLAVGEYVVKVQDIYACADSRLLNVVAAYKGGATVDIPETLLPEDATLSTRAWVKPGTVDSILFTAEGYYCDNPDEWAKWKVKVTTPGTYNFTANTFRKSGSMKFNIAVLNSDESSELISNDNGGSSIGSSGNASISTGNVELAVGEYVVKVQDIYKCADSRLLNVVAEFIGGVTPTIIIDEEATSNSAWSANVGGAPVNVELTRSFVGGMYNTISLPFAVEEEGVVAAFGTGVQLMYMTGATLDGTVLDLEFAPTTSIYQGTPYLIKPVANVTNPTFTGVSFTVSDASESATGGTNADFIGTFIKTTIDANPNNLYLQSANELKFSDNPVTIKGTRAYFQVNIPGGAGIISRARIVAQGEEVSAVELVNSENNSHKVIENGQLIIIRDGVRYNVMGIVIEK